ncbi:MAG: hypothetical protein ABI183_12590 [Polyangiaceae bacterium]
MNALPAVWFVSSGDGDRGATAAPSFEAPSDRAARALVAWGEARGITIGIATRSNVPAIAVDSSIADSVEKELTSARDALTRLDADATEHALVRARALLRAHPELPQAAWLLAEVERGWSARWMRISPPDPDRAARAWQRAAELDGGRAAGIGETDRPKLPDVAVTFSTDGDRDLTLLVDGAEISLGKKQIPPGEHAVVTMRRGRILWANWVSLADQETVRVPSYRPVECTTDDLDSARLERRAINANGVACGAWIAATPWSGSAIRVAQCAGERCGPWVIWQTHASSLAPVLPPHRPGHKKSSPWVAVAAVVLAAAMVTGITLVAAGVFDSPPHETHFIGGGVKTSSIPNIP